jgi:hypothetical protein
MVTFYFATKDANPIMQRIVMVHGDKLVLVIWPCGNPAHPMHAVRYPESDHTLGKVCTVSEGLEAAMHDALAVDLVAPNSAVVAVLLPFIEEIRSLVS